MAQHPEEPLTTDAQILARLRRAPQESESTTEPSATTLNDGARAEALKRLVDSQAAPKAPMSSFNKTLRDLRAEMVETAYAAQETANDVDRDLMDARVAAQTRESDATNATNATIERVEPDASPTLKARLETHAPAGAEATEREPRARREDAQDADATVNNIMVVSQLRKGYVKGKKLIPVLRGVDLTVRQGEFLAVVGQSGSGKSTLLHLMGTLDTPDSGTIYFDGQRIDNLPISQRDVLRNHFIGMIFQFYHLLPELTTLENVLAPLMVRHSVLTYFREREKYSRRAKELLDLVGLSHRLKHKPNELSGGEMQRASIARALMTNPRVLLADEPTGNLDSKASTGVLELLRTLNREQGLTIVMVTHDMSQARDADRAIRLVDGAVYHEEP